MSKTFFSVQSMEREADVYIFGDITPYPWDDSDVSAQKLVNQIRGLDVDAINVHIDSYGGSVSEGWAIYNALREHPAKVKTYGDGFVASAALYPFLAGDERVASNLSAYYLHQVMIYADGYADDLRKAAEEADTMTDIGIRAFTERTCMDAETVKQLMQAETWLTPETALEYGIATAIKADDTPRQVQTAKKQIMQSFYKTQKPPEPKNDHKKPEPATLMQILAGIKR